MLGPSQKLTVPTGWTLLVLFSLCCAFLHGALALDPYVTVTAQDGTVYSYFKSDPESPITAIDASKACRAAGGTLASLGDALQVNESLWSDDVISYGSQDPALLWIGIKITWPASGRRMLRAGHDNPHTNSHLSTASAVLTAPEHDDDDLLQRQLSELEATGDTVVPYTTADGVPIPPLLRLWMYDKHVRGIQEQVAEAEAVPRRRGLLARDGAEPPMLRDSVLTWEDGADASFVRANPDNLGFLACTKKSQGCCGAVYDIGRSPYYPAQFPTIFFYPCDSTAIAKASPPWGYTCAFNPIGELPKPVPAPAAARSPPPPGGICKLGSAPNKRRDPSTCQPCKRGFYGPDGNKCLKCPPGYGSRKGWVMCKKDK